MNFKIIKSLAQKTSTATVTDVLTKEIGAGTHGHESQYFMRGLKTDTPYNKFIGEAVTVRSLPMRPDLARDVQAKHKDRVKNGDPMMLAFEECGPGKVLIIDSGEMSDSAVGGDTKMAYLDSKGTEGLVTDGGLRDRRDFAEVFKMTTWCGGYTPLVGTKAKLFPYEYNVSINCAGVLVRPGDYVYGDENGVISIPAENIEDLLNAAVAREAFNTFLREKSVKENISPGDLFASKKIILPEFLENADLTDEQKTTLEPKGDSD